MIVSGKAVRGFQAVGVGVVALSVALTIAGVAFANPGHDRAGNPRSPIVSEALSLLPGETLTDWVTYGDALVQATMSSSVELPVSDDDVEQAYVPRGIVLTVTKLLWSRPGTDPAAVPTQLHLQLDGWVGATRRPIQPAGEPEMRVNATYVVLLSHLVPDGRVLDDQWVPTSMNTIVPLENGVLNKVNQAPTSSEPNTGVRATLTGRSLRVLLDALASARPDPAAGPYMSLPPDERYQHALSGR